MFKSPSVVLSKVKLKCLNFVTFLEHPCVLALRVHKRVCVTTDSIIDYILHVIRPSFLTNGFRYSRLDGDALSISARNDDFKPHKKIKEEVKNNNRVKKQQPHTYSHIPKAPAITIPLWNKTSGQYLI